MDMKPNQSYSGLLSRELLTLKLKKGFKSMTPIYLVEMDCDHPTINLCPSRFLLLEKLYWLAWLFIILNWV